MVDKNNHLNLRQGDIIKINLNPTLGHEQDGYRPCMVMTKHNKYLGYMFGLAPITNTNKEYPLHIKLPSGLITTGKVLLDQHRMIDVSARKYKFVETVSDSELVEECVSKLKLLY